MTDDSIITFGVHKFTRVSRIPAEYFLKIHEKRSYPNKEVKEYIINNLESLKERQGKEVAPLEVCPKFLYASEKLAKEHLKAISTKEQENKKPIRCYECPKCGGWHLTSKPLN